MNKSVSRPCRRDIALIGTLLAVSLVFLLLFFMMPKGNYVSVSIAGEHYADLPLHQDQEIVLQNGEFINILVIRDGKAYISKANCPDRLCAEHRPVFRVGESIVCLPHQVVITVIQGSESDVDIIV